MRISVEMSLYPLQEDYASYIHSFLDSLNSCADISVKTNAISTQIFGEYDAVMSAINASLKKEFEKGAPLALVTKILSLDRENSRWNQPVAG